MKSSLVDTIPRFYKVEPGPIDTGQNFKNSCPKAYFFKAYTKVKNPKVGSFLRAPEDFEGIGSQKNLIFQNAQIKV